MASKFATRCQTPYPDSRELCQQQSWLDVGSRCAEVWSKKNDAIIPARHHGRFLAAAARHRPALGQGGEWPEQIFAQQKICLIFFLLHIEVKLDEIHCQYVCNWVFDFLH